MAGRTSGHNNQRSRPASSSFRVPSPAPSSAVRNGSVWHPPTQVGLAPRPAAGQPAHMPEPPKSVIGQPQPVPVQPQPTPAIDRPQTAPGQLHDLPSAAKLTGLTVDALRKRARRGRLVQVKGNDGTVRVQLTTADLEAVQREWASRRPDASSEAPSPPSGQRPVAVQPDPALQGQLARAETVVGELQASLARTQGQAEAAAALAEARRDDVTAALVRAARAEGEAEGLREALREARRPAWRRLFGWD